MCINLIAYDKEEEEEGYGRISMLGWCEEEEDELCVDSIASEKSVKHKKESFR